MLSQEMAQRIEHWKLTELSPYPKNPRRHSDAQIAQIAGSIAHFGFNSSILIDAKGSIIAGHGRYLGALKLGLEMAPVIILDHISEIEKRAYLLADNKLDELSEWDDDTLASELAELKNSDIDLGDLSFSATKSCACSWRMQNCLGAIPPTKNQSRSHPLNR
jgi:ParB-like chromosome segregation protein Spo0J